MFTAEGETEISVTDLGKVIRYLGMLFNKIVNIYIK